MQKHQVTLKESEWEVVIKGIHNLYLKYGGYYEDEDVYEFNSELDSVIQHIKEQINESH
jgi:hypothetical protein